MEESIFNTLQNKLIMEEGFSTIHSAIMTADILKHYDEAAKELICAWAAGQDVSDAKLGEFYISEILEELNCTEFQAICILEKILRDPEAFADAILVLQEDRIER